MDWDDARENKDRRRTDYDEWGQTGYFLGTTKTAGASSCWTASGEDIHAIVHISDLLNV